MMKPTKKKQLEDVDAESMSGLGLFQQSLSEPALAMAYFNKAVDVSPERSKHLHLAQRAKLHLENKRPDLAIEDLEAAIALQPKWYDGLDQLAAAYEGAGMWVLALQTYQEMVAARPDVIREVFQRMNNVTQRLVGEVNELQQRKGSAVVKGNAFAAEIASLKTANERLEGEAEAEKQQGAREKQQWEQDKQQWARTKQQWERAEQQGARDKEELERQLEEMHHILEIQEEGNARPRVYTTEELDMELLRPRSSTLDMEELLGRTLLRPRSSTMETDGDQARFIDIPMELDMEELLRQHRAYGSL
jgi:tetratricopeptide (TPR) repeat protein